MIDASSPSWREQAAAVEDVLAELGVAATPRLDVYNKIDLLTEAAQLDLESSSSETSVPVSAARGSGLDRLRERVTERLDQFVIRTELKIPYREAGLLSRLYEQGKITSEVYDADGVRVAVALPCSAVRDFRDYQVGAGRPRGVRRRRRT